MNLSEKEKYNALNEVRILASIRHPNVIMYKEAFLEEKTNSLWYQHLNHPLLTLTALLWSFVIMGICIKKLLGILKRKNCLRRPRFEMYLSR